MKMYVLLVVLGLSVGVFADDYAAPKKSQAVKTVRTTYTETNVYHGVYKGKCGNDGFYWRDEGSFVICSNSNAYVQPCAPGSKNSGQSHYNYGKKYSNRDFCDVNLVDYGYAANHGGYNGGYGGFGNAGYGNRGYGGGYGGQRGYGGQGGYGGQRGYGGQGGYGGQRGYGGQGYGGYKNDFYY